MRKSSNRRGCRLGTAAGVAILTSLTATHPTAASASSKGSLVHTYSIVARDAKTGELGVAVQSHWFSVGSIVSWAEAGVGAVATQSLVEVSYGPRGLELMRRGRSALEALQELLAADPQRETRQVAMVDARGDVAVHTGNLCIAEAGHEKGEQFSVQANLMLNDTVWGEMARAFRRATGSLTDRLMVAMEAGQLAGGDIRGKQSAAILVVKGTASGEPWRDRVVELRIEDHATPIQELKRLVRLHRAYEMANRGDEYLGAQRFDEAMKAYAAATDLAPHKTELKFWKAASLYKDGDKQMALPLFAEVFRANANWAIVVPRLGGLDVLASDPVGFDFAVSEILSVAPEDARQAGLEEWEKRKP